jgi:hypothetical protein
VPRGVDAVTVRTLEPPAPLIEEPVPPAARVVPTAKPAVTPRPRAAVRPPPAAASQAPRGDAMEAEVAIGTVLAVAAPASAPPPLPVYRVRLAPPARLHYEMKRGMLSGNGDLVWKPGDERYELRLEANVAGLPVLTEVSTGLVGRRARAAALHRPALARAPWRPPTSSATRARSRTPARRWNTRFLRARQDRLSWMLQLGGVLNAEPQHAAPGGERRVLRHGRARRCRHLDISLCGPGQRGVPGGVIRAVKFTRAPRQTYDRLVEIWLDRRVSTVPFAPASAPRRTAKSSNCCCAISRSRERPRARAGGLAALHHAACATCAGDPPRRDVPGRPWLDICVVGLSFPSEESRMQMLYNSDSFAVVMFDVTRTKRRGKRHVLNRGGYEIVDKFARKEIFIEGALAQSFKGRRRSAHRERAFGGRDRRITSVASPRRCSTR